MMRDETILDALGVLLVLVAVAAFSAGYMNGVPIPQLLESVSPLAFGGVAAVAGAGAVLTFLKNR